MLSDDLEIPAPTYRVPRHRQGLDSGTKRLALIAGGLGGALVLVVAGWSMLGHHGGGVPVIEADSSPMRVKPDNPGGMQVGGANEDILSDAAGEGGAGKLAPGAETPAPQNLGAPPAASANAPPAVSPAPPASSAPPPPVAAAPPAPAAPPHAAVADHAAAPPSHAPSGKGALVQLGALPTEDAAKTEWARLEKKMPTLLSGRSPVVSRTERDGKTYWRLRTGGFTDIAQATSFCEQVRAKGVGCSIAAF